MGSIMNFFSARSSSSKQPPAENGGSQPSSLPPKPNSELPKKATCDSLNASYSVVSCPDAMVAVRNTILLNPQDIPPCGEHHKDQKHHHTVKISPRDIGASFYYEIEGDHRIPAGSAALSQFQRTTLGIPSPEAAPSSKIEVQYRCATSEILRTAETVKCSVSLCSRNKKRQENFTIDRKKLQDMAIAALNGKIISPGQIFGIYYDHEFLRLTIDSIQDKDSEASKAAVLTHRQGNYIDFFLPPANVSHLLLPDEGKTRRMDNFDINFTQMGVGGMGEQLQEILTKGFVPRIMPPEMLLAYGTKHSKGILLYGPPGTGKTLIARTIAGWFETKKVKVVNGPEILSKWVGNSEENIRNLFREAELEWAQKGKDSELHIIIFDEIDAICKSRGTSQSNSGVGDSIVNQLLTKIDGVNSVKNVLIIGMTNRKDLLDEALLRPGRLDIHIEVSLPDEKGRLEILLIHTKEKRENGLLDPEVDLAIWAAKTENYTGADLELLVSNAEKCAHQRNCETVNGMIVVKKLEKHQWAKLTIKDFEEAFEQIIPAFGVSKNKINPYVSRPLIHYNTEISKIIEECSLDMAPAEEEVEYAPPVAILLTGKAGAGKTTLAAHLAVMSKAPFIVMLESGELAGKGERERIDQIDRLYKQALESPRSVLILDDLEGILSATPTDEGVYGVHYSNETRIKLQHLLTKPISGKKQLIILATACSKVFFDHIQLSCKFSSSYAVPSITQLEEVEKVLKERGVKHIKPNHLISQVGETTMRELLLTVGKKRKPTMPLLK